MPSRWIDFQMSRLPLAEMPGKFGELAYGEQSIVGRTEPAGHGSSSVQPHTQHADFPRRAGIGLEFVAHIGAGRRLQPDPGAGFAEDLRARLARAHLTRNDNCLEAFSQSQRLEFGTLLLGIAVGEHAFP